MSEYILRNEAYQELHEARCCDMTDKWGCGYNAGITEAMDIINNIIPPADVAPVVHAHWANDEYDIFCSNCRMAFPHGSYPDIISLLKISEFCPQCGAKMDESEV